MYANSVRKLVTHEIKRDFANRSSFDLTEEVTVAHCRSSANT